MAQTAIKARRHKAYSVQKSMFERNHDDSHSVPSKSLPQFQAFLFKSGETALVFGVSWISQLSTIY
jgi:hypothetical protein